VGNSTFKSTCLLIFFGPFIKLRIANSDIVPLHVCIQAAGTIDSLLHSYGRLYHLRRTPCFMPIIALASNIMHVVHAEIQASRSPQLQLGISTLQEMAYCHTFAKRGVKYLYNLEGHRSLGMGNSNDSTHSSREVHHYQYVRRSICFVEAGIENLPPSQANPFHTSIIAPFPGQGLPSLSFTVQLQRLGFELASTQI
jgi:hypothetical protein